MCPETCSLTLNYQNDTHIYQRNFLTPALTYTLLYYLFYNHHWLPHLDCTLRSACDRMTTAMKNNHSCKTYSCWNSQSRDIWTSHIEVIHLPQRRDSRNCSHYSIVFILWPWSMYSLKNHWKFFDKDLL